MDYEVRTKEGISYLVFPKLEDLGVFHMFTLAPADFTLRPPKEEEKRKALMDTCFKAEGVCPKEIFTSKQVHSNVVRCVEWNDFYDVLPYWNRYWDADGMITNTPGTVLLTKYADCIPVLLYDRKKKVLANVHSGWRGTLEGIVTEGIRKMMRFYHSDPKDILAFQGPSIGPLDFEVTAEVEVLFRKAFPQWPDVIVQKDPAHWLIDTKEINVRAMAELGVLPEHMSSVDISTPSDSRFHSYRRDGKAYGLMGLLCGLF